jgi:hypothetical protein
MPPPFRGFRHLQVSLRQLFAIVPFRRITPLASCRRHWLAADDCLRRHCRLPE